MTDATPTLPRALALLERLVAFDTTSRASNLALIDYVRGVLAAEGVEARVVPSPDGRKANLWATLGPSAPGGVVLSGHTDVVPTDGQAWTSDPFRLAERDGRLYGRGTCDMKGFLALALALAGPQSRQRLRRPVHLAFSYDEEVGCLGAPALIEALVAAAPRPAAVIVGEPTGMAVVSAHKGIAAFRIEVVGREAHSSQTQQGISAIMEAAPLLAELAALAGRLRAAADPQSPFVPPEPTLTVGLISGGTAGNILARRCEMTFDLRFPAGFDPDAALAGVFAAVAELDRSLSARWPEAGARIASLARVPPLAAEPQGAAERLARSLTGDNGPAGAVAYGAEAGQFQAAGLSTVICGPGRISEAHQADEYVELEQMRRGAAFMDRLVDALA